MNRATVLIVAAGEGRRFGSPKQFALLRGRSVLDRSLGVFESHPLVAEIILVLPDETLGRAYTAQYRKISAVVRGGARRQDSVEEGFRRVDPRRTDIVLVHDGARPLVTPALIRRVIRAAEKSGAAIPALPLSDTVKDVAGGRVLRTLDRTRLVGVQTPQGFATAVLGQALERARADHFVGPDDAALVEHLGHTVTVVDGDATNIKITTLLDLTLAEAYLDDENRTRI
jgi:2-C-methyl-D-erythritol 4-phosphate cytidylyltransferase